MLWLIVVGGLLLVVPAGCVVEALLPERERPQVEEKVDGRWMPTHTVRHERSDYDS